jgi:indole-3-acetate monooxygenase
MKTPLSGTLELLRVSLPALADEAKARAEEFEHGRGISPDYVTKLKVAGVYKVLVSSERGGLGGTLNDWLEMATTLAYADASTGWTAGHGAVCGALIENIGSAQLVEEFFSDPMASAAWSNLPKVEAKAASGGLRVSGRWSFGTGCVAATHVGGMVPLAPDEHHAAERFVVVLARREAAAIDETWDPVGLAGTGSHDIVFDDVFIPQSHIFAWPDCTPNSTRPTSVFVPGTWFISMCAAATHLGLARRAVDEARRELAAKVDRFSRRPLLEKPTNLCLLEEAEGLLFACRAGLEKTLEEVWHTGCRGEVLDKNARMQVRLAAVTAVHQCERIVRSAYDIAGASAIRKSGALQRLYRDASCLTHHISANRDSFEVIGRARCGFDPLTFRI